MIEKFSISRDDGIYEAWPDVLLTPSGGLLCIFAECTHHGDRSYTRIMLTDSEDRGRTWTPKRPLTEGTQGLPYYNCGRIMQLRDGRYVAIVDKVFEPREGGGRIQLYFSEDGSLTWSEPTPTPARGIVPDKLLELESGRWILSCHDREPGFGYLVQRLWYSDDQGQSWSDPVVVGRQEGLNLCEVSILPVGNRTLVAFMRENSFKGWDCYKAISRDDGESWGELVQFPLPACHRPVSGLLQNGKIMITHRFIQGGRRGWGTHQNFFAGLTDLESVLADSRDDAATRILPIDFDRSESSDTGYSGWVQFEDGEIYIVNYVMDDAPKGQIRGYSLTMEDFML